MPVGLGDGDGDGDGLRLWEVWVGVGVGLGDELVDGGADVVGVLLLVVGAALVVGGADVVGGGRLPLAKTSCCVGSFSIGLFAR